MEIKESLELSAQCWCDQRTENKTMDEQLAIVFAETLKKHVDRAWVDARRTFIGETGSFADFDSDHDE